MSFHFKQLGGFGIGMTILAAFALVIFSPKAVQAGVCGISQATAQGQSATYQAQYVPVTASFIESNTYQQTQATCLWQGLAQAAAKVALQKMTDDMVNWINNGFEGNPGFPTNPEAFFLQGADAISGEFLSQGGPLSQLCSPFSIDIRLSLSLNTNRIARKQYACTLSTIFNNIKNGPQVTVNGKSLNGFLGGDFRQGGWPAFLEMTTNPSNNVYGAYLSANSDLKAQVAANQASIQADLSLGNGIMSWQKCTDGQTYDPASGEDGPYTSTNLPPGTRIKENGNGTITYQHCQTETPGSVIGSSLNKQLGSNVDEIVNIHDIDQAVSTIASTLIMKALQTGLASASKQGTGEHSNRSLIDELTQDKNAEQLQNKQDSLFTDLGDAINRTLGYVSVRQQAVDVLVAERAVYMNARACYVAKPDTAQVTLIDNKINNKVDPTIATYASKIDISTTTLSSLLSEMAALQTRILAATSTSQLRGFAQESQALLGREEVAKTREYNNALGKLEDAKKTAADWHTEATNLLNQCQGTTPATTPTT